MARPLRVEFEGAWYHGMNRGAGRRRVFRATADVRKFLDLLGDVSTIFGVEIHAYCLMSNHYHLLVRTPEAGLGRAMRHLNGVYTQYFNRRTGRDGSLFRGRYRANLVDSDAYLLEASRYIHLNPVEAGIVDRPEDYVHSSYRAYLDPRTAPDWLVTTILLGRFGPNDPRGKYQRFVEQGIEPETRAFYEKERPEPVLGGDAFKATIQDQVEAEQRHTDREIPDSRRLRPRPDLPTILAAVAVTYGIDTRKLRSPTRGRGTGVALARCTALYLGRHDGGARLSAIATWLGYRSYNSAATALTRFRRRLDEPALRARIHRARSLLYKVET